MPYLGHNFRNSEWCLRPTNDCKSPSIYDSHRRWRKYSEKVKLKYADVKDIGLIYTVKRSGSMILFTRQILIWAIKR